MNHDVFRQLRLKDLVPTDHFLAVLLEYLQQSRVEVSLECVIVFDPFRLHEGLYRGVAVPLFAFVLIAADVHVRVGKKRGHLAEKTVENLVDLFASRIECGFEDSRTPFDGVGTRSASEFGVTNEPTRSVTRYVKLWNH